MTSPMHDLPLRRHWTSIGLVMMKATVSGLLGLWMAFGPDTAFVSPAWQRAFEALPRQVYGATYTVIGVAILGALWRRADELVPYLLVVEGFEYVFFALVFATYAASSGGAGIAGALVWAQIALAHALIAIRISAS